MRKQFIVVMVTIFVLLSAVFYSMKTYVPAFRFSTLEAANAVMAALSVASFLLIEKQLEGRPHAFVRGVYSASFLKLMVCMIGILIYVLLNRSDIHKPTVYVLFVIYAIYTVTETLLLSKLVRDKN